MTKNITKTAAHMAHTNSVNLDEITGTGQNGRILKVDVVSAMEAIQASEQPPAEETKQVAKVTNVTTKTSAVLAGNRAQDTLLWIG